MLPGVKRRDRWVYPTVTLKNMALALCKRRGARDVIGIKRKDTEFEVQIHDNAVGGYSIFFLSDGRSAVVHISAGGGVGGEISKAEHPDYVVMPVTPNAGGRGECETKRSG